MVVGRCSEKSSLAFDPMRLIMLSKGSHRARFRLLLFINSQESTSDFKTTRIVNIPIQQWGTTGHDREWVDWVRTKTWLNKFPTGISSARPNYVCRLNTCKSVCSSTVLDHIPDSSQINPISSASIISSRAAPKDNGEDNDKPSDQADFFPT
ncbi:hypothetical protein H4Q26_002090 [Puccinia striiformis f. sp. tritici PST-130]|nr:hypothetical protein H4Q26_002090 [Puccinia striiformis f. sp. tritici PST-130]